MQLYRLVTAVMKPGDHSSPFEAETDEAALDRAAAMVRPGVGYRVFRYDDEGGSLTDAWHADAGHWTTEVFRRHLGEPTYHEDGLVKLTPYAHGPVAGVMAEHDDGHTEYVTLNPSSSSDDGSVSVFVYQGATGDPAVDPAYVHFDFFTDDPLTDLGGIVTHEKITAQVEQWFDSFDGDPVSMLSSITNIARGIASASILERGKAIATVNATNADVTEYWIVDGDCDEDAAMDAVLAGEASLLHDEVTGNEEGRTLEHLDTPAKEA